MSKIKQLKVIECPYGGELWLVDRKGNIHSEEMNVIAGPREVGDYENCGVYLKAGVPYERQDVPYKPRKRELPHQAIARGYSDVCCQTLMAGVPVVLAGGFCANNVGAVGGIQRAYGKNAKIGIVWLDAHGDAATPQTSKSGLYNGMPVTTIMGQCLKHWASDAGLEKPIEGKYILMGDLGDTSGEQLKSLRESGVSVVDSAAFHREGIWKEKVNALAEEVAVLTLFCVYFEKHLDDQDITNLSAMRMLGAALSEWKEYPNIQDICMQRQ